MGIVQKATRTQETLVAGQLADDFCITLGIPVVQIVNCTHVVHAAAGDVISRLCERHTHDPCRPEGNDLYLVASPGVPDDQFTVQRSGDAVSRVTGKVYRIDLVDMTFEILLRAHPYLWHIGHIRTCVLEGAIGRFLLFFLWRSE